MEKIERAIEEKEDDEILDQTIALEFMRQHTDLYDKKLENRFSEIIAELVNDKIEEHQTKLLKAVIKEIEERKKYLEENQVSDGLFEKLLITEDDKIINLIKESIKKQKNEN